MKERSAISFEQALAEVQVLLDLPYPERDALRRELLALASESPLEPAEYIRSLSVEKLTEIGKGLPVDLSKKVRYAKEVYGVEGILGVRCWNAGECFITIVAKMGCANDWAAYVGALPNRKRPEDPSQSVTEEEVVRYTVQHGGKMRAEEAAALFGLPKGQYRR